MKFAYARVSTKEQNLDRQLLAFYKEGVAKNNIYCDKQSGKDFNRTNYLKLRKLLSRGDVLLLHSLDRLGRDYDMILDEWRYLTVTIGCDVVVLDFSLLDTRERKGDLTGKLICNIVLELLSYFAQREREKIRERQREGIDAARLRGVVFGRPTIGMSEQDVELLQEYLQGKLSVAQGAMLTGMSVSTFYRRAKALYKSLQEENTFAKPPAKLPKQSTANTKKVCEKYRKKEADNAPERPLGEGHDNAPKEEHESHPNGNPTTRKKEQPTAQKIEHENDSENGRDGLDKERGDEGCEGRFSTPKITIKKQATKRKNHTENPSENNSGTPQKIKRKTAAKTAKESDEK